jgi:uncharacterized membrane protein YebE (DUF533 family)
MPLTSGNFAPEGPSAPDSSGSGERMGHAPSLIRAIAQKILGAHLKNREKLLEDAISDLQIIDPTEAKVMVLAMIAAAHADGAFDDGKRARIRAAMHRSSMPVEERARIEEGMSEPPSLESLLLTIDQPKRALRFYAASLNAIDKTRPVSRLYLAYLAQRLGLASDQVVSLNRALGMPQ